MQTPVKNSSSKSESHQKYARCSFVSNPNIALVYSQFLQLEVEKAASSLTITLRLGGIKDLYAVILFNIYLHPARRET